MTSVERTVPTGPEEIFDVLADGWLYPAWVVGASHIRDVDPDWPAAGSRLHHSSGAWPLQVHDVTIARTVQRPHRLELTAKLWRFGTAEVTITLTPLPGGHTRMAMEEAITEGPLKLVPQPLQQLLFKPRNAEALSRLADLAAGRSRKPGRE
jgi:uncharacterized protein YndB with AHSA1/START domain